MSEDAIAMGKRVATSPTPPSFLYQQQPKRCHRMSEDVTALEKVRMKGK